jgi:hypothetical protein
MMSQCTLCVTLFVPTFLEEQKPEHLKQSSLNVPIPGNGQSSIMVDVMRDLRLMERQFTGKFCDATFARRSGAAACLRFFFHYHHSMTETVVIPIYHECALTHTRSTLSYHCRICVMCCVLR